MGIISRTLDSVDNLADATADATISKFNAIVLIAVALLAVIAFLIIFALNEMFAVILAVIAVLALHFLDIGSDDASTGPRE